MFFAVEVLLLVVAFILLNFARERFLDPYDSWGRWFFTLLGSIPLAAALYLGYKYITLPKLDGGNFLHLSGSDILSSFKGSGVFIELPKVEPKLREKLSLAICRELNRLSGKPLNCDVYGKIDPPYIHIYLECNFLGFCHGIVSLRSFDSDKEKVVERPIGDFNFKL